MERKVFLSNNRESTDVIKNSRVDKREDLNEKNVWK